jgi:hypothetical protein
MLNRQPARVHPIFKSLTIGQGALPVDALMPITPTTGRGFVGPGGIYATSKPTTAGGYVRTSHSLARGSV